MTSTVNIFTRDLNDPMDEVQQKIKDKMIEVTNLELTDKTSYHAYEEVYPFLLERQQTQEAFFVELPQYGNAVAATQQVNTSSSLGAGRNQIPLIGTGINNIKMGDMFDLINSNDSLHLKAYNVTKVNTTTNTIFFSPGLQRRCANGDTVTASFTRPRIRVRVKGAMLTYQVKANGLYTFSVNVEEALA